MASSTPDAVRSLMTLIQNMSKDPEDVEGFREEFLGLLESANRSITSRDRAAITSCMLQTMEAHPQNDDMQLRGCCALHDFFSAHSHDDREIPMLSKVIRVVANAMKNSKQHACEIHVVGCSVLFLCFSNRAEQHDAGTMQRAVTAMLESMKRFEGSEDAQRLSMKAMAALMDHPNRYMAIAVAVELGGIKTIMKSLQAHPKICSHRVWGCSCLLIIAESGCECVHQLWSEQVLPFALKALSLFAACDKECASDLAYESHMDACKCCYKLVYSMYDPGQATMHSSASPGRSGVTPGIHHILDVMAKYMHLPELVKYATWAMDRAAMLQEGNIQILASPRGIKLLHEAMNTHMHDKEVLKGALSALTKLLQDNIHMTRYFNKLCGFDFILKIMGMHVVDAEVQVSAAAVIMIMMNAAEQEHTEGFSRHGGIRVVVKAMRAFHSDRLMQYYGCAVFKAFIMSSERTQVQLARRNVLVVEGALDAILDAMQIHQVDSPFGLMTECMGFIGSILHGESSGKDVKIRRAKAINMILKIMLLNMGDEALQACANKNLCGFAHGIFFADLMHKADGISTLVMSMNKHPRNAGIQYDACFLLHISTIDHVPNQDRCAQTGAMDTVLRAVDMLKNSDEFLHCARHAVLTITYNHVANTDYALRVITPNQAKRMTNLAVQQAYGKRFAPTDEAKRRSRCAAKSVVRHDKDDVFARIVMRREENASMETCVCCGKTAVMVGLKRLERCSACTIAPTYCGVECQRACWRAHKDACKANRK
jgi:hypothetical protein